MTFTIVQNDTVPPISSRLTDSGEPIDLTNVQDVHFHIENRYDEVVVSDNLSGRVNITNASSGDVEYVWRPEDTEQIGSYEAEFEVVYDSEKVETFPSRGKIDIEIVEQIE